MIEFKTPAEDKIVRQVMMMWGGALMRGVGGGRTMTTTSQCAQPVVVRAEKSCRKTHMIVPIPPAVNLY